MASEKDPDRKVLLNTKYIASVSHFSIEMKTVRGCKLHANGNALLIKLIIMSVLIF